MAVESPRAPADARAARRVRHTLIDRLFHWLSAASIIVLLATAFLPILGAEFAWVTIHWVAGLVLFLFVLLHIVRAIVWQGLGSMWISLRDIREFLEQLPSMRSVPSGEQKVSGKYSLAQKFIHHAFSLVVLTAIGTGLMMLVKIDTPWWERDPYWVSDSIWAIVYVLHDLTSLLLVTMIIVHIYFAFRPEKLHLTRSMILGWITGSEYDRYYDGSSWTAPSEQRAAAVSNNERE